MNTATLDRASQLEYATITVQFINPKKDGQRNASIKDVDGLYFWIKPEDIPRYQPGASYEISYVTTQSNGYTNRTIKSAEPVAQQRPAAQPQRQAPLSTDPTNYPSRNAPPRAQAQQARPAPVQRSEPIEPPRQPAPQTNGNGYRSPSPQDRESMFICSQMNALISSRQIAPFSAEAVADHIVTLAKGYRLAMTEIEADQS